MINVGLTCDLKGSSWIKWGKLPALPAAGSRLDVPGQTFRVLAVDLQLDLPQAWVRVEPHSEYFDRLTPVDQFRLFEQLGFERIDPPGERFTLGSKSAKPFK